MWLEGVWIDMLLIMLIRIISVINGLYGCLFTSFPPHWLTINDISEERWIIDVITEETYMGEVELGGIKQAEDWQG